MNKKESFYMDKSGTRIKFKDINGNWWTIPLRTMLLQMVGLDDVTDDYHYYIYNSGMVEKDACKIKIDGVLYSELSELLFD